MKVKRSYTAEFSKPASAASRARARSASRRRSDTSSPSPLPGGSARRAGMGVAAMSETLRRVQTLVLAGDLHVPSTAMMSSARMIF